MTRAEKIYLITMAVAIVSIGTYLGLGYLDCKERGGIFVHEMFAGYTCIVLPKK